MADLPRTPAQSDHAPLAVRPTVIGAAPLPNTTGVSAPAPVNAYLKSRVMSASPEELRLLLIEGAIKFAQQGREGVARKDFEGAFTGLSQSREIVLELMTSIRSEPNPGLAEQVKALYSFIYTQLVEGGFEKDLAKLDTALQLLEYERETWVLLMQRLADERGQSHATIAGNDLATPLPTQQASQSLPRVQAPNTPRPTLSLQG